MDNNPVFLKSSMFGGFKKKEVLSYIFELNESTQEAQQKFAEQVEELGRSRDELLKSSEEAEARLNKVQAELDEARLRLEDEEAKNSEYIDDIERLNAELEKHDADMAEKDGEIARFAAINAELADKNRRHEEKRSQVELAASQIAGILGKAREDADRVVDEAREEAARIILDAQNKADALAAQSKTLAERRIEVANQHTEAIYNQFGDFCAELQQLSKTIKDAASEMIEKAGSLDNASSRVVEAVPEKLPPPEIALEYELEEDSAEQPADEDSSPGRVDEDVSGFTGEILGRYGVRKDDSGFFRLAIEKK